MSFIIVWIVVVICIRDRQFRPVSRPCQRLSTPKFDLPNTLSFCSNLIVVDDSPFVLLSVRWFVFVIPSTTLATTCLSCFPPHLTQDPRAHNDLCLRWFRLCRYRRIKWLVVFLACWTLLSLAAYPYCCTWQGDIVLLTVWSTVWSMTYSCAWLQFWPK